MIEIWVESKRTNQYVKIGTAESVIENYGWEYLSNDGEKRTRYGLKVCKPLIDRFSCPDNMWQGAFNELCHWLSTDKYNCRIVTDNKIYEDLILTTWAGDAAKKKERDSGQYLTSDGMLFEENQK